MPYSTGATKRKANSIGSVMHVRNDVSAAESIMPPTAFGKVKKGMKVQVVPEITTNRVEGTVVIIDSLIDAASGTFGVFLEVPNPDSAIPAGIKCRATAPFN